MKKLTAGILTVMLGIVSANSADAAVASKGYVDAKVKTNADAIGGLTTTVNQHTTDIAEKVSQSAYDTKIGELVQADTSLETAISNEAIARENADNAINTLVGTLPEGATATTIVGYIQERTDDIATDAALGELSDKVTANTGAIDKLNGTGDGSVAKQIADSIAGLDLANTYDAKGAAAAAETAAKAYADGLAGNYATAAQGAKADTALQQADITTGSAQGTISVKGADVAVTGLGSAAYTNSTAYDVSGAAAQALADAKADTDSKIANLALQAISKVPAECSNMTKYCVLTYGTNGFVWEVIERADGETGGSSADTTQP